MQSKIEQRVMANVGAVYTARALTGATALKVYVLILSLWTVGRLVWVSRVLDNFVAIEKNGIGAAFNYALYAIGHTHVGVQVALLLAAAAFVMLVVDAVKSLSASQQHYSF
jgi:hypothetical protein